MDSYSSFVEAGIKRPDWGGGSISESKPQKMKLDHEKIRISSESFPYLRGVKVGEECEIKVKVKKTGEEIEEREDKGKKQEITLEILKISEPETSSAPYKKLLRDGQKSLA